MIGIDTNVLVRLLTGDDAAKQRLARDYLARRSSRDDPAWINRIVAVESVWVLERRYRFTREQIARAFEKLLETAELAFEDHDLVRAAVAAYARGSGFADALIAHGNAAAGCTTTITFDSSAAQRSRRFTALS